ncbi:CocE/NonD family hydrolase [Streptomyces spongiae]|uniref:CocE/NonD family hydrolase n=1 Tax=Streptomyces spongiae TaxID=565072 RepID=A0A5N8XH45_9ACTN|nr:CocE/NonD family hydrolase [Streptomyces spongiae]MPY58554.1 CocE/NonD family hydrolase [Streptomyces spongiae]
MRQRAAATYAAAVLVAAFTLTGRVAAEAGAGSESGATGQKQKAAVATAGDSVTHTENKRVPKGARWTQHYFPSSDGSETELHADVLLPEKLPKGKKVPVILSASSYFGHSGELGPEGWKHTGPSKRFQDFMKGTDLFDQGYAFVAVDTRGFGGSTGCLDFGGPGEQADVKAAINWSAQQSWSTGSVGMYGMSFDAYTGLIGNNLKQDALKAVVAQEPVWDAYKHFQANGLFRWTSPIASNTYNTIASLPQLPDDDKRYRANADYEKKHPECAALNSLNSSIGDPDDPYWADRSPAKRAKGTDTPLFFTQGFIEPNTKGEGMEEFLDNHEGPERGWLGQWDHVRGDKRTQDGQLAMGREGWYKETLSFFDEHLKGVEPKVTYPDYAVQDSTGTWRVEKSWPATDRSTTLRLGDGSYTDTGGGSTTAAKGTAQTAGSDGAGFFVWSEPIAKSTRITGTPKVSMTARGEGNVMVKLYDVAKDGTAVMFDEQVSRLDADELSLDLKPTDWTLKAGHTLAVEIGSVQSGEWLDTPSQQQIQITDARLELALDDPAGDVATSGNRSPYLDLYLQAHTSKLKPGPATITVPPAREQR